MDRRAFFTSSLVAVAGAAAARSAGAGEERPAAGARAAPANGPAAETQLPQGTLGKLTLSRLIAGGNLLSGWCHARDLIFVRSLAEAYLTEERQFDTLELMEENGINAIAIDLAQIPILNKYRAERGGRLLGVVSLREDWGGWERPSMENLKRQLDTAVEGGACTLYLHGGYCDRLVQAGKPGNVKHLGAALEQIRSRGLAAGLGSHSLEVPQECEKLGIEPDYYVKTFHHDKYWSATPKERRRRFCVDGPRQLDHNEFHDNIFCIDPEDTAAFMARQKKPWIAFKVLAGGAIEPESGFTYAFERGADFIAVGMFDFEVVQDVVIARKVLSSLRTRERPWCA